MHEAIVDDPHFRFQLLSFLTLLGALFILTGVVLAAYANWSRNDE